MYAADRFAIQGATFVVQHRQHHFDIGTSKHQVILTIAVDNPGPRALILTSRDRVAQGVVVTLRISLADPVVVR